MKIVRKQLKPGGNSKAHSLASILSSVVAVFNNTKGGCLPPVPPPVGPPDRLADVLMSAAVHIRVHVTQNYRTRRQLRHQRHSDLLPILPGRFLIDSP